MPELSRETLWRDCHMLVGCEAGCRRRRHNDPFAARRSQPLSECAGEGAVEPICLVLHGHSSRHRRRRHHCRFAARRNDSVSEPTGETVKP